MKKQELSKIDQAIKACHDLLDTIKRQQEVYKVETIEDKIRADTYVEQKVGDK
jgi:molybdopterin synthase catalytic subunit